MNCQIDTLTKEAARLRALLDMVTEERCDDCDIAARLEDKVADLSEELGESKGRVRALSSQIKDLSNLAFLDNTAITYKEKWEEIKEVIDNV